MSNRLFCHYGRRRLPRASALPCITDTPKAEWSAGWWAGIAVGLINGAGLAVLLGWAR